MVDIAPELLKRIQDDFAGAFSGDKRLAELDALIKGGKASYKEADEYAARVGDLLADAYRGNVSSDVLPNGKMYYNIAERVLNPTLEENYKITADIAEKVQEGLNEAAGIKIKVQRPELNQDRINGIINLVADADQYDDVEGEFLSSILNFTQSVVTDSVRNNADFHYESGLSPKIVRTSEAGACKWCRALAGTYDYGGVKDTGNDVWRRHRDCRCVVEYDPGNGARQNAHTKQWRREAESKKIQDRKNVGLGKNNNVTKEYIRKANPGVGQVVVEDGYILGTHEKESEIAQWIKDEFGGNIILLNEKEGKNVKTPDLIWNQKNWEIKSISSESYGTIDKRIRNGCKQIDGNVGGLILDFSDSPARFDNVIQMVEKSAKNRITERTDIIIKQNKKYEIIRIEKE